MWATKCTKEQLKTFAQESTVIALDTETTTDPWYSPDFQVLLVSGSINCSDGSTLSISWPLYHPHASSSQKSLDSLSWFLGHVPEDTTLVMQNGSFDILALRTLGIELPTSWFDTLGAQYLLDVEAPKGLEALGQRWLGLPPWKDIDYKAPEKEDLEDLRELCERDAEVTLRLYEPMSEALKAEPSLNLLFDTLLMPAMSALMEMEYEGVPVDLEKLADLTAETEDALNILLEDIRRIAGEPELNPNSTLQLQKLLFGKLGLPVVEFTEKGAPSTAAASLAKLRDLHHIIPMLEEFRAKRKLLTASLRPWLEHAQHDGKLHPRYKPAFVKTGRLSSEMPNIQQVPRDPRVRAIFGNVPGYSVVELDYSQLELRIVAWLSGEATMLSAYARGEDLHQTTADALGVDRQTGKTANFGLLYGAGHRKLRQIAESDYGVKLSEFEAEAIRSQWFATYTDVADFHEAAIAEARREGGVTTIIGRWRPLPDIHSTDWPKKGGAERQAVNTPIQSVASDLTLSVLTDLINADWLKSRGIRPIITVHDSIIFLVPDHQLPMMETVRSFMENPKWQEKFGIEIGVPLLVDMKTGPNWGETEET